MKTTIKIISSIVAIAFLMAGCTSEETTQSKQSGMPQKMTTEVTTLSANQTQVVGTVTSITGNEVVLALGEISNSGISSKDTSSDSSASSSEKKSESMPSGAAPSSGELPSGNKSSGNSSNWNNSSGNMPTGGRMGGKSVEITLTGESATYLIPVGLSVSGASSSFGTEQSSSDFSDITSGMSLRLTLETGDDDTQSIVGVEIISQ